MKTTRRRFLQGLIATVATGLVAPQVLVESVHGASDLAAHERDAVADALGLRMKQWRGFSSYSAHFTFTESETAFSYITYPVLGTDIAGNTGYGQITLPKDTPEEEVRAELEAATRRIFNGPVRANWVDEDEEKPAMLFGYPIETGTFRQSARGLRFEPEHVRDRIAFHLRLDRTETIWTSRGLEPDPDQKSPFVRLR